MRPLLAYGCILVLGLAVCACDQKPKVASNAIPPPSQADNSVHDGSTTTNLPARTGSQSSGVEGSSTVIGAPPKGQAGLATAH